MSSSIVSPFPVFNDLDGTPLEAGYIYIGTANLNPEVSPIQIFWDENCTVPAAQPIRTIGGYPSRNGTPSNVYIIDSAYSITVRNRNQVFVFAAFNQLQNFSTPVSVKNFGAVGNGVADDTTALRTARTFAETNGVSLYWPAGDYLTVGDIDRLHTIRHTGDGAITRAGGYRFWVEPKVGQTNTLYVNPTGADQNDAIDPVNPFATIQAAFDALKNYGPTLNGLWIIQLSAGTYAPTNSLRGLKSLNRIRIQGPSVGGSPNVPTAIIDGTGVSSAYGFYFQFDVFVQMQDIKVQNIITTGQVDQSSGIVADGKCDLYANNVHTYRCDYAGFDINSNSQLRLEGGIHSSSSYNVRLYSNCTGTIGYNGSLTSLTQISNPTQANVWLFNNCNAHIDFCTLSAPSATNVNITNSSRAHIYKSSMSGLYPVVCGPISTWIDDQNTNTCVNSNYHYWSVDYDNRNSLIFKKENQRFKFGGSLGDNPLARFHFQDGASGTSNSSYNSNAKAIFDSATNTIIAIGGANGFQSGFHFAKNGSSIDGSLIYSYTTGQFSVRCGNADVYYMSTTEFAPLTDNNKTLGTASNRWSIVYAGTGTINTSDAREKQQIRSISDAEKAVAVKLKGLLKVFKFNDAVEKKGDNARIHFGVIAQEVKAAFESQGLVAEKYALLCYDEWPETFEEKDADGNIIQPYKPAGNRYGVRYEELFAFIIAAI